MLPRQVSQLPHLDIAAYIKLATEVGGAGERFAARRVARFGQTGGKMIFFERMICE